MADNYTDIHDIVSESQTLITWKAPMRPYKRSGKRVLRFFLAVAFLLSVIIYFFGDPVLLLPIWAILFLFYIMTITPPPIVENKITKFGVETGNVMLRWDALDHFYITQRWGFDILTIVSKPPYNLRTYFITPDKATRQRAATILGEHIMYIKNPPVSITDKCIDLLSLLVPEDDEAEPEVTHKQKLNVA